MDLFVPGSGDNGQLEQVVDMTPGVMPNELFWTAQIPRVSFRLDADSRHALLRLEGYPLIETFQFGNPAAINGRVDLEVFWTATGPANARGRGTDVDPTDPAAFLGHFRDARATAKLSGWRPGLSFRSRDLTSDGFYASVGPMRNGSYLT